MTEEAAADWWDETYESEEQAVWDLGRPQPALRDLIEGDEITGRVLDVGCGTGSHAVALAECGHGTVGIDLSEVAIEQARDRVADRDLPVTFRVDNALDLDVSGPFDAVLDAGVCHVFDADQRVRYADELAAVLRPGGTAVILVFGADAPEDFGPHPMGRDDVRAAFDDGWTVERLADVPFETTDRTIPGLLAVVHRIEESSTR